jgi:two-component system sensor histidine kinase ChvG
MKLRHQLFFISLSLLVLPWGAWQYLQAVDVAMRSSQTQSLLDSATLIADRLSLESKLFDDAFVSMPSADSSADKRDHDFLSLYAYPLTGTPIIDGYGDEWRNSQAEVMHFSADNNNASTSAAEMQIGTRGNKVYFYLKVSDNYLHYYNPSAQHALSADHIRLQINDAHQQATDYLIRTSAPSHITAHYYDNNEVLRREDAIKGVWRETAQGYQVELIIDKNLLANGFRLSVIDNQKTVVNTLSLSKSTLLLTAPSPSIQQFIKNFHSPSLSIKVLNPQQWLVAAVNAHETLSVNKKIPWFVEWFYRQLLDSENLPLRNSNPYRSYNVYEEIQQSLQEGSVLRWYRHNGDQFKRQTLASVAVPIHHEKRLLGYVLIEKTTDQLIALMTSAFSQLFIYTMGAFFIVAFILLAYASWLSLRISRLNRIANSVIGEQGSIHVDNAIWPDLTRYDELGDLSRSYRQLLVQQQEYNDYLRTLSSKLSHELRTPIAVVKSSLENMGQVEDSSLQKEYSQRAQQGIQRLNAILSSMSSASSVEQSVTTAEFETTDLQALLTGLAVAYNDAYKNHTIHFHAHTDTAVASIDQDLFVQMMDKLLDNASDFSPASEPINIHLSQEKNDLIIDIENIGPLLPESMQNNLFESMISVRKEKTSTDTHLGLGLYIVRLIAECHSGEVVANNREDGRGVLFSVILPLTTCTRNA